MNDYKDYIINKLLEPDQYVNSYVAYLDMLGFKELCFSKKLNCAEIKAVFNDAELLNIKFNNQFSAIVVPENIIHNSTFTIMSDSIVISAPATDAGLLFVLYQCSFLQNLLLNQKVLLRGGIAKGEFFKCENIMFGPALIQAYVIESSIAIYPRVVIDESIISDLTQRGAFAERNIDYYTREYEKPDYDAYSLPDHDDFMQIEILLNKSVEDSLYYVHYFNVLEMLRLKHNERMKKTIESTIEEGLTHKSEKVRLKYNWLDEYYRTCLQKSQLEVAHLTPDDIQEMADEI